MTERGNYRVEFDNGVISITFNGRFNAAASQKVSDIVQEHINGLNGQPFKMLFNLLNYEGSTPDAHKIGNEHAVWLEDQNCHGKAIVITETLLLNIARNEQTFLKNSKIASKVFESEPDAYAWLHSIPM